MSALICVSFTDVRLLHLLYLNFIAQQTGAPALRTHACYGLVTACICITFKKANLTALLKESGIYQRLVTRSFYIYYCPFYCKFLHLSPPPTPSDLQPLCCFSVTLFFSSVEGSLRRRKWIWWVLRNAWANGCNVNVLPVITDARLKAPHTGDWLSDLPVIRNKTWKNKNNNDKNINTACFGFGLWKLPRPVKLAPLFPTRQC